MPGAKLRDYAFNSVTQVMGPAGLLRVLALLPVMCSAPGAPAGEAGFGGENCRGCHEVKAPKPARRADEDGLDVIIVGGGMAGLSALHYLRDRNVVLLEAEGEAGGQMRQDAWRGLRFAQGAAYFVEPMGFLAEFYRSTGIPPAEGAGAG